MLRLRLQQQKDLLQTVIAGQCTLSVMNDTLQTLGYGRPLTLQKLEYCKQQNEDHKKETM